MVTVKRKVTNENERYVGYDEGTTFETEDYTTSKSFTAAQMDTETTFAYTPREDYATDLTVDPVKEVMPKIKRERVTEPAKKERIAAKTQLMLFAYLAVAVVLAVAVIATGIAISNANNRASQLESELALKLATINSQAAELEVLNDENVIADKAANQGMIKVDNATSVELIPLGDKVVYEASSNWFDKLCDALSKVF